MIRYLLLSACILFASCWMSACATAPRTERDRLTLQENVEVAINEFIQRDPTIEELFEESYAFAVFPSIGKGGIGVGGAYGRGIVYEQGEMIGYTDMTQGTIGLQLGGQEYRQVLFFEDEFPLRTFTGGQFTPTGRMSAIAATTGAAEDATFADGVLIFTMGVGGLMFEAAVGGQNFTFERADARNN